MYNSPVTQKGQVTIPLKLRLKYGIEPYGKVRLEMGDKYIKILPEKDIVDIAGFLKHRAKGKSVLKARKEMEKNYVRV